MNGFTKTIRFSTAIIIVGFSLLCCAEALAQPESPYLRRLEGPTVNWVAVARDSSCVVGLSESGYFHKWTVYGDLQEVDQQLVAGGDVLNPRLGVNADGSIVVGVTPWHGCDPPFVRPRAARRTLGGNVELLHASSDCYDESHALGTNNEGTVVVGTITPNEPTQCGGNASSPAGGSHAFRWAEAYGFQLLSSTRPISGALAISDDGNVVLGYQVDLIGDPGNCQSWTDVVRWTNTNELSVIAVSATPSAMSSDGSVIVGGLFPPLHPSTAFRWTQSEGVQPISIGTSSIAHSVNGDGTVIVGAYSDGSNTRPFIWKATTGAQDLMEHLGIVPSRWHSLVALSISDDGSLIGGVGHFEETTGAIHVKGWVVRLPKWEILDYNNPAFRDPTPSTLWSRLANTPGEIRKGLCADGVSTLLLRSDTYSASGCLRVTLKDELGVIAPPGEIGTLRQVWNPQGAPANPLCVPLVPVPGTNVFRAYVLLTAPADFVRAGHESLDEQRGWVDPRYLKVETEFTACGDCISTLVESTSMLIELHRPPVVFAHGLFDGPDSWRWPLLEDGRWLVFRADYCSTHDREFQLVLPRIKDDIRYALGVTAFDRQVAATQVDYVGHSMGGVLGRIFSNDSFKSIPTHYIDFENYDRGYFHKLITVNAPHFGSQLSNLLVTRDNRPVSAIVPSLTFIGQFACVDSVSQLMGCPLGIPGDRWPYEDGLFEQCASCSGSPAPPRNPLGGAVRDLRPDSQATIEAVTTLSPVPPKVHAMYGDFDWATYGVGYHWYACRTVGLMRLNCGPFASNPEALFSGPNDGVVSVRSQLGGLPPDNGIDAGPSTRISSVAALHWPIIGDTRLGLNGYPSFKTEQLLNASTESGYFGDGFPTNFSLEPGPVCPPVVPPLADSFPFLELLLDPSVPLLSGDNFFASATLTPAGTGESVLFTSSVTGPALVVDPPFVEAFQVPSDYVGEVTVTATVVNSGELTSASASVSRRVEAPAALTGLRFIVNQLDVSRLAASVSFDRLVIGQFSDGVERVLDAAYPGLVITSSDVAVARVFDSSAWGIGVGATDVVAQVGAHSAAVPIVVYSTLTDIDCNMLVQMDDVNAFTQQISGPEVHVTTGCDPGPDVDQDGDADLHDFALLQRLWQPSP